MQAAGACFTVVEDSCSDFSDVLEEDECSNEEGATEWNIDEVCGVSRLRRRACARLITQ